MKRPTRQQVLYSRHQTQRTTIYSESPHICSDYTTICDLSGLYIQQCINLIIYIVGSQLQPSRSFKRIQGVFLKREKGGSRDMLQ
ncbi:hypothetical protein EYC84_008414 [Monilinia fructicola]|uniref:Uncharacterized protein n=1 Tax=Monilinia fructicola TaxID=38448 RepID=A0A5M9JF27_MONFR|nr:hypothetical protein EYC84_008414 [Monilinia fructicola]